MTKRLSRAIGLSRQLDQLDLKINDYKMLKKNTIELLNTYTKSLNKEEFEIFSIETGYIENGKSK